MDAPPSYEDTAKHPPTEPAVSAGYPPAALYPQQPGAYPQAAGAYPPPGSAYPPPGAAYPPPGSAYPPPDGAYSPPGGVFPQAVVVPVSTQPGAVVVAQVAQPKPPDNFIFALITCLCCNACCLGLVALVLAYQSQQSANQNRMEEAGKKGEQAKKLAIASIIVSCICLVLAVIIQAI